MDTNEMYRRGLALRQAMFGEAGVAARMKAFGELGEPLQHVINAYVYGDLWQRDGLSPRERSIAMVAMMAAAGQPNELRVHLEGAVANGCSRAGIQDILLLATMYCGIPAGIDAHRIAAEVLGAEPSAAAPAPAPQPRA
jgi:4-carboxymuconolactone decarboxylase